MAGVGGDCLRGRLGGSSEGGADGAIGVGDGSGEGWVEGLGSTED